MSHFTIMVIGDDYQKALAPYHEFECTGMNDEYVQDMDITEELREEYEGQKTEYYVDENGKEYDKYYDGFYREPTEEETKHLEECRRTRTKIGFTTTMKFDSVKKAHVLKVRDVPNNFTLKESYIKDKETFSEFCESWDNIAFIKQGKTPDIEGEHQFGYGVLDADGNVVKIIRRTNPNSKWDWYQVGGRWSGSLKLKPLELLQSPIEGLAIGELNFLKNLKKDNPDKYEKVIESYDQKSDMIKNAVENENPVYPPGKMGEKSWTNRDEEDKTGFCDQTLKRYIDIDGMEKPMRESATKIFDEWHNKIKNLDDDNNEKESWMNDNLGFFITPETIEELNTMTKEEYVNCKSIWCPYAIVWDGKWYASGEMGWFGISTGDETNWKGQFKELWKDIPDDIMVTMVDAHI